MKKIFALIAIIFVGIIFAITVAAVFFSKGKSKFWVDKKLKIGGILLTLTSILNMSSGCGIMATCYDDAGEPTCYDAVYEPFNVEINKVTNTKTLKIYGTKNGIDGNFSYQFIKDTIEVQSGKLYLDTAGNFIIDMEKKYQKGEYILRIKEKESDYETPNISITVEDEKK